MAEPAGASIIQLRPRREVPDEFERRARELANAEAAYERRRRALDFEAAKLGERERRLRELIATTEEALAAAEDAIESALHDEREVAVALRHVKVGRLRRRAIDPVAMWVELIDAIPPGWTRGHSFCLAHEIEKGNGLIYVSARDGERLEIAPAPPVGGPDVLVRTSPSAFVRMLSGRKPRRRDKAVVRGDARAYVALGRWIEMVRK
jgi:hypothetical protein